MAARQSKTPVSASVVPFIDRRRAPKLSSVSAASFDCQGNYVVSTQDETNGGVWHTVDNSLAFLWKRSDGSDDGPSSYLNPRVEWTAEHLLTPFHSTFWPCNASERQISQLFTRQTALLFDYLASVVCRMVQLGSNPVGDAFDSRPWPSSCCFRDIRANKSNRVPFNVDDRSEMSGID